VVLLHLFAARNNDVWARLRCKDNRRPVLSSPAVDVHRNSPRSCGPSHIPFRRPAIRFADIRPGIAPEINRSALLRRSHSQVRHNSSLPLRARRLLFRTLWPRDRRFRERGGADISCRWLSPESEKVRSGRISCRRSHLGQFASDGTRFASGPIGCDSWSFFVFRISNCSENRNSHGSEGHRHEGLLWVEVTARSHFLQ
jgi:hypothetical protein